MSVADPVLPPARSSSTKTILIASSIVIVAFIAGFIAGVFADHVIRWPGGRRHIGQAVEHIMLGRLDRHLDLTDDQEKKVGEILRRRHERMVGIWDSVRPQVRTEVDATNAEIETVLTPEQREKFQKLKIRLGPPPGAPPPPHERRGDRRRRGSTR